ncbi:condensation domain-containing protein, partial [Duganella sp. Root1480D1]|uniref:condensation domain-containing protein n=1 Tax=Duganella sp. Root1480D1 TaxID=1736471 RepID=UPI000AA92F9D
RAALQATLDRIVARHEGLRTTFVLADGQPVQRIAPADCGFALEQQDLSGLSGHEREFAVERMALEESQAPFDLAQGPLIRGRLLVLGEEEHVLLITQHHIISDGWSIGILVREVSTLYRAFSQGESDPLPPLPLQYADYAVWQRDWLQGGCRRCRCSTLTTRCGSATGCKAKRCNASWTSGTRTWMAHRPCWSCRPTARALRCRAMPAARLP